MRIFSRKLATVAVFAMVAGASNAATPDHLYELNGNFSDTFGGPALLSGGGSFSFGTYVFGANQGLTAIGVVNASEYTIDTSFNFAETSGFRRIVDFKEGSSDTGLYNLATALNFYNVTTGSSGIFANGQPVRVTLSRDAAGTFSGYVNGALQISFSDTGNLATFSFANQTARFFIDDNSVGGEASAGAVDYIAIYGRALSGAEVLALAAPVPEPQTYALMIAGLAVLALASRRRARG